MRMRDQGRIDQAEAKEEATVVRQRIEQLRDELRVRIHLGGMELREAFDKLEREADHLLAQVPPVAARTLNQIAVGLRRISHELDGE
jgi:hypothetical protein